MNLRSTVHRRAASAVLAVAIVSATAGCGGPAAPAAAPASAPPSAAPASAAPTTTTAASPTTDEPAGADASAVTVPVDPGEGAVDGPQLAREVSAQLAGIVGRAPDSVTCPDLPARVGAAIRCELVDGADRYGVAVTVTAVQGTDVKFGIQVDDQPS